MRQGVDSDQTQAICSSFVISSADAEFMGVSEGGSVFERVFEFVFVFVFEGGLG